VSEEEEDEEPDRTGVGMLARFWKDVGIVERYLHQPWSEVKRMTEREFRLHVVTACFWRWKELEGVSTEEANG